MSRLADYFVIVGYDHDKVSGGSIRNGKILQRFPEQDWPDTPFFEGIEWFCQPQGWSLSTHQQEPQFFISVLTNIDGNHHYCACLSFNEKVSITPSKPVDEEEENIGPTKGLLPATPTITHHNIMYAPKCLTLVSKLDYPETFRNCLGTIYTVYLESLPYPLETLIGNILGCIQIPPPGGPQVRFSIGAGDKQALQPPLSTTLPVSGSCTSLLFRQLGKKNVMLLFCAAVTEHKILFHSNSYSRLTESCRALTALMYPLKYTHTYIPILPASLIEVLSTPTPYIMGIHSSLFNDITDVLDVIIADLDGGSISIPESLVPPVTELPAALWEATQHALTLVLQPELAEADFAFSNRKNGQCEYKNQIILDKEIRAIFMRMFAQLFQGYRSCLTLIRINPKPVIEFHKAAFLGSRDLADTNFLSRVLDSMFFTAFVIERGPPFRPCDAWDEMYNTMPDLLKKEAIDRRLVLEHIKELAQQLYTNETPNAQSYQQKILMPPEGAFSRIHQPSMPKIDVNRVQQIINEGISKNNLQARLQSIRHTPRIVPMGPNLPNFNDGRPVVNNTVRKLEVLKTCVGYIFENKIADARKIFPAVMRIVKQRDDARLALCKELAKTVQGNKAMLEHQQFDLIIKLMNRALQDDSVKSQHDVAALLLPLSAAFCRKLCNGVIQFSYSCIQDHPIWKTQMFWEQAFYQDVQKEVKHLYLPRISDRSSYLNESQSFYRDRATSRALEPSALEIAAEQMRLWPGMDPTKQNELISSEEAIMYSQAIHYANRMVYLLIPQDVKSGSKLKKLVHHMDDTTSVSNSVLESRSDHSNEFEDVDPSETENLVTKMVSKFIDKVCTEGSVTPGHIKNLHQMIPGLVDMHIEMLATVHRESKRIPPVQKPKIQPPMLLSGEEIIAELRTFLLTDGREETQNPLLPAEGALFLTNYRVMFKGLPTDSLTCEQNVIRAFPISSLTKEKRITVLSTDQVLPEGLQLRSCTFQLIKVAFDDEVSPESIEMFRKNLNRGRHPLDEIGHFAFVNHVAVKPQHQKTKEKNATLKGFAKKTLLRTAKKAGFKQKSTTKRKYIFTGGASDAGYGGSNGNNSTLGNSSSNNNEHSDDDEDGSDDNVDIIPRATVKDVERLKERSYVKDWMRLGLGNNQFGYRITSINSSYNLCRSYPAILVCPKDVSEDSLKSLTKSYKNHRIPVPTWRHQTNGSTLLRGAVSLAKGVMGMLKHSSGSANASADSTSFQEQDRYFISVIKTLPHSRVPGRSMVLSESTLSIDSLAAANNMNNMSSMIHSKPGHTPNINRKPTDGHSTFQIRGSQNKTTKWGSMRPGGTNNNSTLRDVNTWDEQPYTYQRVPLCFLGERSQSKSAKLSEKCAEFIPVDYTDVRHSRIAFKKLMRACLPSTTTNEPDQTFARQIEQSEWLEQIRSLLQLSGVVVDLMDLQGSSVTLALEDGWDITAQISALAQLCMDPHYRTIEGFRVLIEKEWLAFGHRFGHRSNLKQHSSSGSPFAPTFMQFLDAVHQIQCQFPLAFEFNEFYLKFLAYHCVSCRFRTFIFDCELERVELGITAVEDKRGSLNSHHKQIETGTGSDDDNIYPGGGRVGGGTLQKLGVSVFDYIDRHNTRAAMFYNFMYTADPEHQVLRPQISISMLEIWDYYINEELAAGPSYDLELSGAETLEDDAEYTGKLPKRKVVTFGYDSIVKHDPDAFTCLLDELKQTEAERGILPQKWKQVWDKLELPHSDSLTRHSSFSSALVRSHGRLLHKRSTLEIIMRGQLSGNHLESFSHPHRLEKHAYTTLTSCNHCGNVLWGPVSNGLRCMDCGNSYHEKCADSVPKNCTKYKTVEGSQATMQRNQGDNASVSSSQNTGQTSNDIYKLYDSTVPENITYEGHLFKRGALLKGWKQRWFVLDSIKHQLRYYDSVEDSNCKGHIDLAEVQFVGPALPTPVPSKRIDEKAFFDLKTGRRTYNFYASEASSAQEWIEKIQACLQ